MNNKKYMSRAELVRLRRESEHTRSMERAAREATRPLSAVKPRVKPAPKPKQNKRRFNIALAMPRVNLRAIHLPTIQFPRLRFGGRTASLILVVTLGMAAYFSFTRPELRVSEAQVMGNQILTPAELNSVMGVAGQPIFLLTPSELETRLLLNYPEISAVRVNVSLPNLVTAHIVERKPFIRWEQNGAYTWIADDGVAYRPRGEMVGLISVVAESSPPVIGGGTDPLAPTPYITVEMVQALKGLASHVPPGAVILYDSVNGFGWNDPRGWRAYFGATASDVELKMRVYETMVNSLTQRGIRPALINVTYPTAPYYRMNQ